MSIEKYGCDSVFDNSMNDKYIVIGSGNIFVGLPKTQHLPLELWNLDTFYTTTNGKEDRDIKKEKIFSVLV